MFIPHKESKTSNFLFSCCCIDKSEFTIITFHCVYILFYYHSVFDKQLYQWAGLLLFMLVGQVYPNAAGFGDIMLPGIVISV